MIRLAQLGLLLVTSITLSGQTAWTLGRTNLPAVTSVWSIAFGNGRFVVTLGGNGSTPGVAWSVDGITWRASATPMLPTGTALFTAGSFYCAALNGVWRSADGDTWQQIYLTGNDVSLRSIASSGRSMMILNTAGGARTLVCSPDLLTFRATAPLPNSDTPGGQVVPGDLVYAFGRYYFNYSILTSTTVANFAPFMASTVDGTAWTLVAAPLATARRLAAGSGRFGAVGGSSGDAFITSTDGTTFTSAPIPAGVSNGNGFMFAGGRFFSRNSLQASLDGVTWAPLAPVVLPTGTLMTGIAYGNGRYVAAGSSNQSDLTATLVANAPPIVSEPPGDRTAVEGARTTFAVTLENPSTGTTFQWRRDGTVITGATLSSYPIDAARPADAGRYSVDIRNPLGATSTEAAQLTVVPIADAGRIINLSVLTSIDAVSGADAMFTVGFVVGGALTSGGKSLLVRAGGPSLSRFGVAAPNADPRLELYAGVQKIAENDNWGGVPAVSVIGTQVAAFPFESSASKDAAVFSDVVANGDNSVRIYGTGGATGAVIAEVYDATPRAAITSTTPRLVNVSVLKPIATGTTLSAGFVIGGLTHKTVLVRVVGPSLSAFGLSASLADPQLNVFRPGTANPFATNDDWGGTAELTAAFATAGAFALPPSSRDAALLLTLEPGNYVAQASASTRFGLPTTGTALVEIYEVP